MNRIAIISDIHGNIPALEATLDDIGRRGIQHIVCLGDLVGKGPDSARAVDVCRVACETVIMGNWDDFLVTRTDLEPANLWHREQLGAERLDYLATLPKSLDFWLSGRKVRLFHASPTSLYRRIFGNDTPENLQSMFADGELTDAAFEPDIVGYADIHVVFMRHIGHKMLFNVGSVGNSLDLPQAYYVIFEGELEGRAIAPFSIQFVQVAYNNELAIRQAEAAGMPFLAAYAHELRTGQYVRRTAADAWPQGHNKG